MNNKIQKTKHKNKPYFLIKVLKIKLTESSRRILFHNRPQKNKELEADFFVFDDRMTEKRERLFFSTYYFSRL